MRTTGTFILHVEPTTVAHPAMVSIALTDAVPDAHGILHLTSGCLTLRPTLTGHGQRSIGTGDRRTAPFQGPKPRSRPGQPTSARGPIRPRSAGL